MTPSEPKKSSCRPRSHLVVKANPPHSGGVPQLMQLGGSMLTFAATWTQEVLDDWVCILVSRGYRLEFFPSTLCDQKYLQIYKKKFLFVALDRLLSQGVIVPLLAVESSHGFYSKWFPNQTEWFSLQSWKDCCSKKSSYLF